MFKSLAVTGSVVTVCLVLFLLATSVCPAAPETLVIDNFNAGLHPNWKSEEFKGQTRYSIVALEGDKVLKGESAGTASALVFKKKYSLQDYPVLAWRWKVEDILSAGDARSKETDDYAARIYVVFHHWFVPMTRSINYIWANKLPQGAQLPNSYVPNSVLVAVQSGRENTGRWITERHNVREDYLRIFGEEPSAVVAIAIMTDSDDTHSRAVAWFDDIRIERE